ncbi:MAG: PEP-CTERM sorting domain-containing protein [Microcystaceae cyanobacterium]
MPEPASVLGILAFGALGAGAILKRQKDSTVKEKV